MSTKFLKNEKLILNRVSKGDAQAFELIYEFYQPRIFSFCLPILHSETLSKEVAQEALLKIWLMGPDLKKINSLDAYLKSICRNLAIDFLRKQQLSTRVHNEQQKDWLEAHNETEEYITLNETRHILNRGISLLPPRQQFVFQLINQDGMPIDEVASKLNITKSTVQTHLKLAKRFLREYLVKHTDIVVLACIFNLI